MLRRIVLASWVPVAAHSALVAADPFNWQHEASGSGWAPLYNGHPADHASDATTGPDDWQMRYYADRTEGNGSLAAGFLTSGWSQILTPQEGRLELRVELTVQYAPSFFPGGDVTGGEGAAELFSVIEFIMPADEVAWHYYLDIDLYHGFDGATEVVAENVTQSQTLLALSDANQAPFGVDTMLDGNAGDLIFASPARCGAAGSSRPESCPWANTARA